MCVEHPFDKFWRHSLHSLFFRNCERFKPRGHCFQPAFACAKRGVTLLPIKGLAPKHLLRGSQPCLNTNLSGVAEELSTDDLCHVLSNESLHFLAATLACGKIAMSLKINFLKNSTGCELSRAVLGFCDLAGHSKFYANLSNKFSTISVLVHHRTTFRPYLLRSR